MQESGAQWRSRRLIVSRARALGHVLLKDEKLIRNLTYDRQQQCCDSSTSLKMIGSIDLDSGIDEYQSV